MVLLPKFCQNHAMNRICHLLSIDYPIIQAGMVWVSGGKLAAASANAGIAGVIGAGSMNPELLEHHITKALSLTSHPQRLVVNVPLLYGKTKEQLDICVKLGIKNIITAGIFTFFCQQWTGSHVKDYAPAVL